MIAQRGSAGKGAFVKPEPLQGRHIKQPLALCYLWNGLDVPLVGFVSGHGFSRAVPCSN